MSLTLDQLQSFYRSNVNEKNTLSEFRKMVEEAGFQLSKYWDKQNECPLILPRNISQLSHQKGHYYQNRT